MILDNLKKTLYAGVGMAFLTRDKIEEMAKKLAEEAKLNETEGKKFIDEILKKSEDAKASVERTVTAAVDAALAKLDLARSHEVKALEARVKALEAKAGAPEARSAG